MGSSDDEEIVPRWVTNYYFVDEKETPISFTVLPICWDEAEKSDAAKRRVFLCGTADDGLQKVYKQVTSWRLRLQDDQPEVLVLLKDDKWIKLRKPRKSYEDRFRTIMITLHWLHFLERKPEASEKSLWDHLHKVFSSFEVRPSQDDLRDHVSLIKLFAERDKTLAKSQLLLRFFKEKLRKRSSFCVVSESDSVAKKPFIAYNNEVYESIKDANGDELEEQPRLFDSVCAICDNGGEILCCQGKCLRSFHATRDAGTETDCESLGYSRAQVEAIQNFFCKNCRYKQHQCFACGKLGSSDKTVGAEVFPCVSATCGHFYHPKCVALLLFRENNAEATKFQKKVAAGESFTCPIHKCIICKQGENREIHELQFAICRRCPTSYHRKCLPSKFTFEDLGQGILQRAWDGLLPNRILIYCLKHNIDVNLGTPIRSHIIFPEIPEKRNKIKITLKKRQVSDNWPTERPSLEPCKLIEKLSGAEESCSVGKGSRTDTKKVHHFTDKAKHLKGSTHSDPCKVSLKDKKKYLAPVVSPTPIRKNFSSSFPRIDSETVKRIKSMMDEVSSSLTLEDVKKKCMMPSTHAYSARHISRSITQGKLEGSVEAIRTALRKLEDGVSVDDAKAVCEPKILDHIIKLRNNLGVYLAPFLHGMRYTSFGRHFTKVDKLKEIVDKLQWYVQNGDMIVDFCCGANDFSRLMKEKLDATGKKCSFKNYDVIQPKNDFNFEKRDWMTVEPKELRDGSQLIMGLNPPFGVKAALANKFINRALTFRPKLLILIVPKETERLDEKDPPYDLIWEDPEKLSGMSFYLPGSIDTDDKQIEQWNVKPPPLYLWSRRDWTTKHKEIATRKRHTSETQRGIQTDYHPPVELDSNDGYKKRVATAGDIEVRRGFDKRKPEQNLEALEDREEPDELSDMDISPTDRSGYSSIFEGSAINHCGFSRSSDTGFITTYGLASSTAGAFMHLSSLNETGFARGGSFAASGMAPLLGGGSYMGLPETRSDLYSSPGGFASGPLPSFSHQGSSGGWLD